MIKPESELPVSEMQAMLEKLCLTDHSLELSQGDSGFVIRRGQSAISILFSQEPHVVEESKEIAEAFAVPCEGCYSRYELEAEVVDDEIFNDFIILIDILAARSELVLFDAVQGKHIKQIMKKDESQKTSKRIDFSNLSSLDEKWFDS